MSITAAPTDSQPLIVQVLLRAGALDPKDLVALRESPPKDGEIPERALIRLGLATDREIAEAYAQYLAVPLFDPPSEDETFDHALSRVLPEKLCRDQLIVPVALRDGSVEVAFVTPNELFVLDEIQLLTGLTVSPMIAPLSVVEGLLELLFSSERAGKTILSGGSKFEQSEDEEEEEHEEETSEVLDIEQTPPPGRSGRIVRMVNQILQQAVRASASDIHLEPFEDACKIRLRVDGVLHELAPPSKAQFVMIVSRFKVLAKMDIAEKRIPQDGAIAIRTGDRRIDLRVNTVPTVFGEKMVMRLLDKANIPLHLTGLGFDERQSNDLVEAIRMPHGLMLVTGPTGSGKSTTLYACLNLLNEPTTNICTVEDPVEYKFKGMNQVQVKSQVGLTFMTALRAFLRQDPDVIMVGEVRDQETAQICLRAALTGHFVLSTIHTNDSLSAVTRLQDMGIEPFLLASTLRALEAQRLVRKLCPHCKEPHDLDALTAKQYGLEPGERMFKPKGCDACRGVGYRGRIGIFEVVRITAAMAKLIQQRTPLSEMREAARHEGMKLLIDSGIAKARLGVTSLEAVLSVAMSDDE
jgi:type IV pilus assembly protein PilB